MMNFTVLIADDEAMPRTVLQKYIPWEELSVTSVYLATDGEEALEQARRVRPQIIISDIKMPHLSGLEMAAAVREFLPECQFVFLSGYSDKEYLKGAIRLKAANYVEKPLNLEEITAALREITTQLLCQAKPTAEELFFQGGHFPDKPLNTSVFGDEETVLNQLDQQIRHNKKRGGPFCAEKSLRENQSLSGHGSRTAAPFILPDPLSAFACRRKPKCPQHRRPSRPAAVCRIQPRDPCGAAEHSDADSNGVFCLSGSLLSRYRLSGGKLYREPLP